MHALDISYGCSELGLNVRRLKMASWIIPVCQSLRKSFDILALYKSDYYYYYYYQPYLQYAAPVVVGVKDHKMVLIPAENWHRGFLKTNKTPVQNRLFRRHVYFATWFHTDQKNKFLRTSP